MWIDVHPVGEIKYTRHIRSPNKPYYVATFHVDPIELDGSYCSQEKELLTQSPTRLLTHPHVITQFLSPHNHWSNKWKPIICWWTCYIGLLGPYLQYVSSMFNTCSRVPTPRSLTDTDGSYNLRGADFFTSLSPPFPNDGPLLSPNYPVWSQVNILKWKPNLKVDV
jgi:hypothetical protein